MSIFCDGGLQVDSHSLDQIERDVTLLFMVLPHAIAHWLGSLLVLCTTEQTSPRPASHIPFLSIGLKIVSGQPKLDKIPINRSLCPEHYIVYALLSKQFCLCASLLPRRIRVDIEQAYHHAG
jgi:hypothetical protein